MTKRTAGLLVGAVVVIGGVAALATLDPAARVQGWVGGEPFHDGRSATAWGRDLASPDAPTRTEAAQKLTKPEAVPVLRGLLGSDRAEVRLAATDAARQLGPAARDLAPQLVARLDDPDQLVRTTAARAVGELAPDVPGAVDALAAHVPDAEAIRALAKFGPAAAPAVDPLLRHIDHADATVRWNVLRTLGDIGPAAAKAVPAAVGKLTDADPQVREHAAETLGQIGPAAAAEQSVGPLAKTLADPEWKVRRDAVRSLGQMGPAAKGVLPQVKGLASDPKPEVVAAAEKAARLIDPDGK